MDLQIGLYTLRLCDSKSEGLEFIDIEDNNYSFSMSQFLKSYFKVRSNKFFHFGSKAFKIKIFHNENTPQIQGCFSFGNTDDTREILDTTTGEPSYQKKNSDVEVRDFHFVINFERGKPNRYYIAIQRWGTEGVKTAFEKDLQKYFKTMYPNDNEKHLKINLINVISRDLILKDLEQSTIKELRLLKNNLSLEDKRSFGITSESDKPKMELKVSSSVFDLKPKITSFFKDGDLKNIQSLFPNASIDYDTLKVTLSLSKGHSKTLDFTNLNNYRAQYTLNIDVDSLDTAKIFDIISNELNQIKSTEEYF